jgi:hypothetical protein
MIEATKAPRRLIVAAIVAPLVLGAAFVPVFRWLQTRSEPAGSLQGVDMAPFAERDALLIRCFAFALVLVAMGIASAGSSWRTRAALMVAGAAAAVASYWAVFASLYAG